MIKLKKKPRKPVEVGEFLIVDPGVCSGRMTFKGTRVPVETILNRVAQGRSIESLRESWPEVSQEAIEEAIRLNDSPSQPLS